MILPDSRCEVHGETLVLWKATGPKQQTRAVCRSCRREAYRQRKGGLRRWSPLSTRCRNGHPKTPFNYGIYGNTQKRCKVCARERGRLKR